MRLCEKSIIVDQLDIEHKKEHRRGLCEATLEQSPTQLLLARNDDNRKCISQEAGDCHTRLRLARNDCGGQCHHSSLCEERSDKAISHPIATRSQRLRWAMPSLKSLRGYAEAISLPTAARSQRLWLAENQILLLFLANARLSVFLTGFLACLFEF